MTTPKPQHSPEPWDRDEDGYPRDANGARVRVYGFALSGEHNEGGNTEAAQELDRRIVACVNACQGLSVEALESGALDDLLRFAEDAARRERDNAVLNALRALGRLP